jgi:hypothetical protein
MTQIVGVVLVRDEDFFVEQAVRNVSRSSATSCCSSTTALATERPRSWAGSPTSFLTLVSRRFETQQSPTSG